MYPEVQMDSPGRDAALDSVAQQVNAHFAEHVAVGDRQLCIVHVRSKETEDAIMAHFAGRGAA